MSQKEEKILEMEEKLKELEKCVENDVNQDQIEANNRRLIILNLQFDQQIGRVTQ